MFYTTVVAKTIFASPRLRVKIQLYRAALRIKYFLNIVILIYSLPMAAWYQKQKVCMVAVPISYLVTV